MTLFTILAYVGLSLLLLVSGVYVFHFKKLAPPLKIFCVYLLLLSTSDLLGKYLWMKGESNLFVLHGFSYLECILMGLFYRSFYRGRARLVLSVAVGFVLLCLLGGSIYAYPFDGYNELGFFVLKLFMIVISTRELYLHSLEPQKHYYFINLGLLLSAVINLVLFSFGNLLTEVAANTQKSLWILNSIVFIISLLLVANELLLVLRKSGR